MYGDWANVGGERGGTGVGRVRVGVGDFQFSQRFLPCRAKRKSNPRLEKIMFHTSPSRAFEVRPLKDIALSKADSALCSLVEVVELAISALSPRVGRISMRQKRKVLTRRDPLNIKI